MLCLLTQPQEELQLNLKTSNTQNCQKIELCGSPTTKDLKKQHSSRPVGGVETLMGWRHRVVQRGSEMGMGGPTSTNSG